MNSKQLIESQLCLYFAVGPVRDENDGTNSNRQLKSYKALDTIFDARSMAELGQNDTTVSETFRHVPFELCECEWDSIELDGDVVYSVCFHSGRAIGQDAAITLRDMALEAYTQVCGTDARYIRAELFEKWSVSNRAPFEIGTKVQDAAETQGTPLKDILADPNHPAHADMKAFSEQLARGEVSLCACIGPVYGEPYCACEMRRRGLPQSAEHVRALATAEQQLRNLFAPGAQCQVGDARPEIDMCDVVKSQRVQLIQLPTAGAEDQTSHND